MKLIKHSNYIFEYENIVSDEICDEIVSIVNSAKKSFEFESNRDRVRYNDSINLTEMANHSEEFRYADNLTHEIFSKCHLQYTSDNKLLNYVKLHGHFNKLQSEYFYRYYQQSDYFDWHVDLSDSRHLTLSYMLYLNDDFVGGNTLFLNERLKIIPKKRSMICFPCDYSMLHKSTRITSGQKNILWSCFENHFLKD